MAKAEFRSHSAFLGTSWWKGVGWKLGKGLAVHKWTLILLLPEWESQGVFQVEKTLNGVTKKKKKNNRKL